MIPLSIVTLGQFVSQESIEMAIKSFSMFYHNITAKHQKRVKLVIVDDKENNAYLKKLCKIQEIEDVVEILNLHQQEAIERSYKSSTLFFLPVKENKDALVQESLSYGLLFIGFDKLGYEEYIDQTCGMLLKDTRDEENIIEFGRWFQLLYFDPEAREFLKRGAMNRYTSKFSWGTSSGARA